MYAQKGDSVNIMENKELALHAKNIRRNIVKEVYSAQSGHPGGSLGATDILTELYFEEMDINEENLNTFYDAKKGILTFKNAFENQYEKDNKY